MARANVRATERIDRRLMRFARTLLLGHATALVFGLAGMLIALPHPELWSASSLGQQAFAFGMQYAGPLHMVLGAAAMLAFGGAVLGWRRTLLFFGLACGLSLASELIGTGTGYPFGNYEYTSGLGYKVLGRVPFGVGDGIAGFSLSLVLSVMCRAPVDGDEVIRLSDRTGATVCAAR